MTDRIVWLRIALWAGAIADAVMVVAMLVPEVNRILILDRAADFEFTIAYRFAMAYGAALMAGWTLLLIWAAHKPLERRGVLPLTAGVVAGLFGSKTLLYANAVLTGPVPLLQVILPIALIALFVLAYANSWRGEPEQTNPA